MRGEVEEIFLSWPSGVDSLVYTHASIIIETYISLAGLIAQMSKTRKFYLNFSFFPLLLWLRQAVFKMLIFFK